MVDAATANRGLVVRRPAVAGSAAEQQALAFLRSHGLSLVERNYRCRFGEIDLIMLNHDTLVFVEVRSRRSSRFGGAAASVDRHKRAKLTHAAEYFLTRHRRFLSSPARFDVVCIDGSGTHIEWLKDAFRPGED